MAPARAAERVALRLHHFEHQLRSGNGALPLLAAINIATRDRQRCAHGAAKQRMTVSDTRSEADRTEVSRCSPAARILHHEAGIVVVYFPRWWEAARHCYQIGVRRARKDTFTSQWA